MGVHNETWTDEKVATLRRLHEAGEPFSSIGFAVGMTRNATIGKARRLGLLRRVERKAAIRPVRQPQPKAARPDKPRGIMPAGGLPKDPDARRDVFCAIADKANERFSATSAAVICADNPGVRFLDRGLYQCAFPLPDWDEVPVESKRSCGRPVKFRSDGAPTSYCVACSRVVYAPSGFAQFKGRAMGATP